MTELILHITKYAKKTKTIYYKYLYIVNVNTFATAILPSFL
jgi:hypothetical protein